MSRSSRKWRNFSLRLRGLAPSHRHSPLHLGATLRTGSFPIQTLQVAAMRRYAAARAHVVTEQQGCNRIQMLVAHGDLVRKLRLFPRAVAPQSCPARDATTLAYPPAQCPERTTARSSCHTENTMRRVVASAVTDPTHGKCAHTISPPDPRACQ
ncbi:hypothetical protein DFH06DRAFT_1216431 [Mycena polygramma]|nr:hypothetical protein DFH06DRAFT_1216431 [Mycena polygramma]